MQRPVNERVCRGTVGCGSCKKDLKKLRAIDFAIQETVLYLDAYPENRQALEYYHKLIEMRGRLLSSYEKTCGPLTMYGNVNRNTWEWVEGPWPWENDAN